MKENLAFVFSPQGTQRVEMGKEFHDNFPFVEEIFAKAEQLLIDWGWGPQLRQLCFDGPPEKLNQTQYTQPALYVFEAVGNQLLRERNIIPSVVSGHSFGMVPATFAAGVLDFESGLRTAYERGQVMARAGEENPGKMTAVNGSMQQIIDLITQSGISDVWGVNDNSPLQTVVAGRVETMDGFRSFLKQADFRFVDLPVSIAAHSPLMQKAAENLQIAISHINFKDPTINLMLDNQAAIVNNAEMIKEALIRQLTGRVMWVDCVKNMIQSGVTEFVEVGPRQVLNGLIRQIDKEVQTYHVSDLASLNTTLQALT